jgi:DNA (cytosine-5)-methyltransferase 1
MYRLGELFCGPGGIARGAAKAIVEAHGQKYSISHAWATDYHPDTCDTYRKNIFPHNPEKVVCKDIRKLDLNKLKKLSSIDALAFGFQ